MKLKRACVNILTSVLSNPKWYEGKVDLAYLGGCVLVKKLPEFSGDEPPKEEKAIKEWLQEEHEVELTEKEIDAVKVCLKYAMKQSTISLNMYIFELMDVFGLNPEPEEPKSDSNE